MVVNQCDAVVCILYGSAWCVPTWCCCVYPIWKCLMRPGNDRFEPYGSRWSSGGIYGGL